MTAKKGAALRVGPGVPEKHRVLESRWWCLNCLTPTATCRENTLTLTWILHQRLLFHLHTGSGTEEENKNTIK